MFVNFLHLQQFRNFNDCALELNNSVNIFTGPNGSGKTNLLEAIETLCLGRSGRLNATDQTLILSGTDFYRIEGKLKIDDHEKELSVSFQNTSESRGKRVTVDGQRAKLSQLFRDFSVVSISPEDSEIISGSPGARRKFLDQHLSQASVIYLDDLSQYQRVVTQRNSHLKQFGIDDDGTPFDHQLIEIGSKITKARIEFLEFVSKTTSNRYSLIATDTTCTCQYIPSALRSLSEKSLNIERNRDTRLTLEKIKESFAGRLSSRRTAELMRQTTLVGPHRDDFVVTIGNLPGRTHGSQGEWRSAAIALKLAAFAFLNEHTGKRPLLLLDEVFAELDIGRQHNLAESFGDYGQLFLTTALEPPAELKDGAAIFSVNNGQVTANQV